MKHYYKKSHNAFSVYIKSQKIKRLAAEDLDFPFFVKSRNQPWTWVFLFAILVLLMLPHDCKCFVVSYTCSLYGHCCELPAAMHLYSASSLRTCTAFLLNVCSQVFALVEKWLSSRRRSHSVAQVLICHPFSLLPNIQRPWPTAHRQERVCRTFSQQQRRLDSNSVYSTFFLVSRPHADIHHIKCVPSRICLCF